MTYKELIKNLVLVTDKINSWVDSISSYKTKKNKDLQEI